MANLSIEIKDSKFVSHNGVNVKVFTENYVLGNGWECKIAENGRIDCISTQFYAAGERHQMKFKIDKGYVKVLLKIGDAQPKVLKSFKLDKWPVDGILVLPTGYMDKRKPHFRKVDFQEFLDENVLSAVRYENPNQIYRLIQEFNGHTVSFKEEIETDGNSKLIPFPIGIDEKSDLGEDTIVHMIEVEDANWVIKTVYKFGEIKHRILYTLEEPQKIVGLPKPE